MKYNNVSLAKGPTYYELVYKDKSFTHKQETFKTEDELVDCINELNPYEYTVVTIIKATEYSPCYNDMIDMRDIVKPEDMNHEWN